MKQSVVFFLSCLLIVMLGCDVGKNKSIQHKVKLQRSKHTLNLRHALRRIPTIPLKVRIKTNQNDMKYRTKLTVGGKNKLVVFSKKGNVTFTKHPITATYFHMSRLLIITEGDGEKKSFHYFVEPYRWSTSP